MVWIFYPLQITGSGKLQYGKAKNCDATDGEMDVKFEHSTTQEARYNESLMM